MVKLCLDFSAQREINLSLHQAVNRGDENETIRLLKDGGRVNSVNIEFLTTLHEAIARGHSNLIKHLLEYNGNIERPARDGLRPIHMLIFSSAFKECLHELINHKVNLNGKDAEGRTILQLMINQRDVKMDKILQLLHFNVDVNTANAQGNNCLHDIALNKMTELEKVAMAKVLIKNGINPNKQNFDRKSPLHIAVAKGLDLLVELLLRNGADVELADDNGQNPLDMACSRRKRKTAELITRHIVLRFHRGSFTNSIMQAIESNHQSDVFNYFNRKLESLKNFGIIENSYVSLYEVLMSDIKNVSNFVRNPELMEGFHSSKAVESSPFRLDLIERLREAEEISRNEDDKRKAVNLITGNRLPTLCVNKIADFLNAEDFPAMEEFVKELRSQRFKENT